jgi:hypothetical protein
MASDSLAAVGAKMQQVAALFTGAAMRRILTRVVAQAKTEDVPPAAAAVTGGDGVLSGMGKKGRRLNARYKVLSDYQAVLTPTPPGPWALVTDGSKGPFPVPKRKARVILNTPDGPRIATLAAPIVHPKVPAKHAWQKVTETSSAHTGQRTDALVQDQLRRVFG